MNPLVQNEYYSSKKQNEFPLHETLQRRNSTTEILLDNTYHTISRACRSSTAELLDKLLSEIKTKARYGEDKFHNSKAYTSCY